MTEMEFETEALSIIKYCKPTTSQEAKLSNIPVLRESDNYVDSIQTTFSSPSVLTPSEPTRILMISLPGSSDSVNKNTVEEDPVFLTPPESRSPSHLSSEDQNHKCCSAEGMTIFEAEKGSCRKTKVNVLEAVFNDELEAKRIGVEPGEDFEGETVPLDDTEVVQIEADEVVRDSNVVSNNGHSALSLTEGSLDITGKAVTIDLVQKVGVLMKDNVAKFDANKGNHELEKKLECVDYDKIETVPLDDTEVVQIEADEIVRDSNVVSNNGDSTLSLTEGSLDITGKAVTIDLVEEVGVLMKDNVAKFDGNKGNHELEKKRECVDYDKIETVPLDDTNVVQIETDEAVRDINVVSDKKGNHELEKKREFQKDTVDMLIKRRRGEKCDEVKEKSDAKVDEMLKAAEIPKDIHVDEEFRYRGDVTRRSKRRGGTVGVSGKEKKVVGSSGKESGLFDLLNELLEDKDGEDVDILETAMKYGWNFPRPRWWPPEGEDWSDGLP